MSASHGASLPEPVKVSITSESVHVATVRGEVLKFAEAVGFDEKETSSIALAIDEALCNIIKHGYGGESGHPIDVTLESVTLDDRKGMSVMIEDRCPQVDADQLVGRDLEDVRPGGLGLHIMKTVMDEIEHTQRGSAGMRLKMTKMLENA